MALVAGVGPTASSRIQGSVRAVMPGATDTTCSWDSYKDYSVLCSMDIQLGYMPCMQLCTSGNQKIRAGDMLAVDRQREDCAKLCTDRGWTWIEFMDNDISASSGRRRPGV